MPQGLPPDLHLLTECTFHFESYTARVIAVLETEDRSLSHAGAGGRGDAGHASRGEVVQFNGWHTVLPQCIGWFCNEPPFACPAFVSPRIPERDVTAATETE